MEAYVANKTLSSTVFEAARKSRVGIAKRMYLRTCFMFASADKLKELEQELTTELVLAGVLPPEGVQVVDGCFVGNWQDFLQWIIDHWDDILRIIMTIIGLFAAPAMLGSFLMIILWIAAAGSVEAQCVGSVCRPPARVLERTKAVVVDRAPVRSVLVKRTVVGGRPHAVARWLLRR
jgi:hypothetical protein